MSSKQNWLDPLRIKAEMQLAYPLPTEMSARTAEELLHELWVHQIELKMQNKELRRAQVALEESRDRYVNLYEFTPVGYFTLNRNGMIDEVNLTGAALLGVERNKLLERHFVGFVAPEDSDQWHHYFLNVLQHDGSRNCELVLQRGDGSRFPARLDCLHMKEGGVSSARMVLTDVTEHKRDKQHLRELTANLLTVREEEKASVAREIHDDLGGTLIACRMDAYLLADELSANNDATLLLKRVESMSGLLDHALKDMRRIITDLRPTMLDDLGLRAALEWHAEQFHKRTDTECKVICAKGEYGECKLDEIVSINMFRIFQESLTNVARHSGASRVEVECWCDEEEVAISISDNGCGLPQGHAVAPISYGIRGMRERVEQLGGKIKFDSQPGSGFSVTVKLPLPADNKEWVSA